MLAAFGEGADRAFDVLDDGRLNAFGRLVEDQQLGARWPARGRSPAAAAGRRRDRRRAASASASAPETSRRCVPECRRCRRDTRQAHPQVFLHREPRKNLAPLRHIADAGCAPRVRRRGGDVAAVELDAAGLGRHQAHQAFAAAWSCPRRCGPSSVVTWPCGAVEADVAQDVAAAVILVEIVYDSACLSAPDKLR